MREKLLRLATHVARGWIVLAALLLLLLVATLPAVAITHGQPDGTDHPNVGSIVVTIPGSGMYQWCSGTLIAENVFLTASHCTWDLDFYVDQFEAEVAVTFDPTISEDGTFYTGQWFTNPAFSNFSGQGGSATPGDVAVIVLDEPPGIAPAALPTAGMLDEMKANHQLRNTRFTAVGYGVVRDTNRRGFDAIVDNLDRNQAEQGFLSLTNAWLTLPMLPTTGNGGTCYGDSGGPHFIHLDGVESDIVAGITVTGDAPCKATDRTYRTDTDHVRAFLADFVDLP